MLYLVGLGLHDVKDLSLKGLEALKKSDRIYAESYTSFYSSDKKEIEEMAGKKVAVLERADLEEHPQDNVLAGALDEAVCLLVCGDPMVATTHIDLVLRAQKMGVETRIIHSSSIYSAVAETGLQAYKFGKTTTLAYPEKGYRPTSPYDAVAENKKRGLHTLVLLDVKAPEKRFMSVSEGMSLLLEMEAEKKGGVVEPDTVCVGAARLGGDAKIAYAPAKTLAEADFGPPPHVIIVPGKLHYMEEEALARFKKS